MTHQEFQDWLSDEVQHGRLSALQMNDLLTQKALFDNERTMIEIEYRWRVVGYVNNQRRVADTVHELLDQAKSFPGRLVYFEPVGFRLF